MAEGFNEYLGHINTVEVIHTERFNGLIDSPCQIRAKVFFIYVKLLRKAVGTVGLGVAVLDYGGFHKC